MGEKVLLFSSLLFFEHNYLCFNDLPLLIDDVEDLGALTLVANVCINVLPLKNQSHPYALLAKALRFGYLLLGAP